MLRKVQRVPLALEQLLRLALWLHKSGLSRIPVSVVSITTWGLFRLRSRSRSNPPYDVDGRRGWQWIVAIREYLDWRGGRAWRPLTDRFLEESFQYVRAVHTLNRAWGSLEESCSCVYCERGLPFYDEIDQAGQLGLEFEKKPPQSAHRHAAALKKAGAR